jgi:putative ABC transport system permease protein
MVQVKEFARYTWKHMKSRKMRAWLTILGVVIGIAAIIGLITISKSMNNAVEEQFEKMGISSIRVVPGGLFGPPTGSLGLDISLKEKIENVKGVNYVNSVLIDYADGILNNEEQTLTITSYETDLGDKGFIDTDVDTEQGRFFSPGEVGSIIIGYDIAYDTYKKDIHLQNTIKINDKKFKVVGILEETGTDVDGRVYMGLEDAQELFDKKETVNVFVVQTSSGLDPTTIGEKIEEKLLKTLDEEEFQVFTPEQLLKQIGAILAVIQIVLTSIASIALLVGAIGIMNSMFTAVLERTREIGVMKAIGAQNSDIMVIVLIEAGFMGTVGGIIGTLIGTILAFMVEYVAVLAGYSLFSVKIEPSLIIGSIIFSFIVGAFAGAIPAYRASNLKPVDALRHE